MADSTSSAIRKAGAVAGGKGVAAASGLVKTLSDPKKTKRLLTVTKIVAPIVAPIALKAVDVARSVADQRRARKLGVDIDDVAGYRGPTGRTKARIDAVDKAVADLRSRRGGDALITGFADRSHAALNDLRAATAATAPMPATRRRPTLAAIKRELDAIESETIAHLVRTGG
jgi:Family of unknown function (DUF6474)